MATSPTAYWVATATTAKPVAVATTYPATIMEMVESSFIMANVFTKIVSVLAVFESSGMLGEQHEREHPHEEKSDLHEL